MEEDLIGTSWGEKGENQGLESPCLLDSLSDFVFPMDWGTPFQMGTPQSEHNPTDSTAEPSRAELDLKMTELPSSPQDSTFLGEADQWLQYDQHWPLPQECEFIRTPSSGQETVCLSPSVLTVQPSPNTQYAASPVSEPLLEDAAAMQVQVNKDNMQLPLNSPPTLESPEPPTLPKRRKPGKLKKDAHLLMRNRRKVEKPERCTICDKGHATARELRRHYQTNHPSVATSRGISTKRVPCLYQSCEKTFSPGRNDNRRRHMKNKHGWSG